MRRLSFYNFAVPIPEARRYLFYNSLFNSLIEIGWDQGEYLAGLMSSKDVPEDKFDAMDPSMREMLSHNGFISELEDEKRIVYDRDARQRKSIYSNGVFLLTICTTNLCNMDCSYCFEGAKTKRLHQDKYLGAKTMDQILVFLNREIEFPIPKKVTRLHTVWYGGEPLLRLQTIKRFSADLLDFSRKHNIEYRSRIITNGSLLNDRVWKILRDVRVLDLQVSIDGDRNSHNKNRPLRARNRSSYDLILENLSRMSEGFRLDIRITTDSKTLDNIENLFGDLKAHGIWPQRARNVRLILGRKRYYSAYSREDPSIYLAPPEFVRLKEKWRYLLFEHYNEWATENSKPRAKLSFLYPEPSSYLCGTASYPYGFALDDAGFIHRCWNDVNNESTRIQHISESYDLSNPEHQKWINFSRLSIKECNTCKYLPICERVCTQAYLEGNYECSEWKYTLEDRFKTQYLMLLNNPELIEVPKWFERTSQKSSVTT